VSASALGELQAKLAFICDMDGVLYHGNRLLPGAAEFVAWLAARMDTDILSGIEAEIDSVLVLSGVTRREDLGQFPYSPAYVLEGVGEIAGAG